MAELREHALVIGEVTLTSGHLAPVFGDVISIQFRNTNASHVHNLTPVTVKNIFLPVVLVPQPG